MQESASRPEAFGIASNIQPMEDPYVAAQRAQEARAEQERINQENYKLLQAIAKDKQMLAHFSAYFSVQRLVDTPEDHISKHETEPVTRKDLETCAELAAEAALIITEYASGPMEAWPSSISPVTLFTDYANEWVRSSTFEYVLPEGVTLREQIMGTKETER